MGSLLKSQLFLLILLVHWSTMILGQNHENSKVAELGKCFQEKNIDTEKITRETLICLKNIYELGDLEFDETNVTHYLNVIHQFCKKSPIRCLKTTKEEIQVCLDNELESVVDNLFTMLETGEKFVCKNDGKELIKLLSDPANIQCLETTLGEENSDDCRLNIFRINTNFEYPDLFDEFHCKEADYFRRCFKKNLAKRCDSSVANFYHDLFYEMLSVTPCKQYMITGGVGRLISNILMLSSTLLILGL